MWRFGPYVSVGERRKIAEKEIAKRRKKDPDIAPVTIDGKKVAKTWWGTAWTNKMESYADFGNRIGRGRSYVKNGLVIDLRINKGEATSVVMGSSPYSVKISITPLGAKNWEKLAAGYGRRIDSLSALVEGRFPKELESGFMDSELFPSPKEIKFKCSCPDYAYMCKHVAATLYAIGARFDQDPTLFFSLRGVDFSVLIKKSIDEKMKSLLKNARKKSPRVIKDADIGELFGL